MSYRQEIGKPFRPTRKLVVQDEWKDCDGYWLLLTRGFHCDSSHAIRESSKSAAYRRVRDVRPCKCTDCAAKASQVGVGAVKATTYVAVHNGEAWTKKGRKVAYTHACFASERGRLVAVSWHTSKDSAEKRARGWTTAVVTQTTVQP